MMTPISDVRSPYPNKATADLVENGSKDCRIRTENRHPDLTTVLKGSDVGINVSVLHRRHPL